MKTHTSLLLTCFFAMACSGKDTDSGTADGTDGLSDTDGEDTGDTGEDTGDAPDLTDAYAFESALSGENSVSYSGQVFRHLLIDDMKAHLGGITDRINEGAFYPVAGDVVEELAFYYDFDSSVGGSVPIYTSPDPGALQTTYDDVSSDKDLAGKTAGNDATGQHKDWTTELVGWDQDGVTSPESLIRTWFVEIDEQAVAWGAGDIPLDPSGAPVPAVYVSPEGLDYQQLLQKFIRGAVAFSQGADDYLDDDTEGKGLLSDHTALDDGKPYTALEHQWDEGFGYFGAARSYPDWTDAEIADTPGRDVNGDGAVDLTREMNWGHSVNAAKRDRGAVAATDYTAEAWLGFYNGRALLAETAGTPLTEAQATELAGYRDQALDAWEKALASTVVHYINDTLQDMGTFGTDDYDFGNHAKHWSEMKGFALAFQFNRRSPMSDADFAAMHALMGQAPVLEDADQSVQDDYAAALIEARTLIGTAYGFDPANLGDDNGENGW